MGASITYNYYYFQNNNSRVATRVMKDASRAASVIQLMVMLLDGKECETQYVLTAIDAIRLDSRSARRNTS
jgi:hypothetical protein